MKAMRDRMAERKKRRMKKLKDKQEQEKATAVRNFKSFVTFLLLQQGFVLRSITINRLGALYRPNCNYPKMKESR